MRSIHADCASFQFETGQDTDDSDPYVCFRRREVRQIRKTRGRDAQSAEKLRRLRKELEDARQLVALVRQREVARKEMLAMERQLFLQRAEVKEMKRKLGIKDDDEDLINQKVSFVNSLLKTTQTDPITAQEKADGDPSWSATQCPSTSLAPQGWPSGSRGFAATGRCPGRKGERDSARYQGEYCQAYQMERGLCGSYPRATFTLARQDIRRCCVPTCIHGAATHTPIIRVIR